MIQLRRTRHVACSRPSRFRWIDGFQRTSTGHRGQPSEVFPGFWHEVCTSLGLTGQETHWTIRAFRVRGSFGFILRGDKHEYDRHDHWLGGFWADRGGNCPLAASGARSDGPVGNDSAGGCGLASGRGAAWMLGFGRSPYEPGGWILSIVGAIVLLIAGSSPRSTRGRPENGRGFGSLVQLMGWVETQPTRHVHR